MSLPARLNFHHLHYFWAVARDGNLTRTAERLRVSQSALSSQIKLLEQSLGEPLFTRSGRGLALTEVGRMVIRYADAIFTTGEELISIVDRGRRPQEIFRLGGVATLSRNLQESFLKPLLAEEVHLRLTSGRLEELLRGLEEDALDLVLSNRPVRKGSSGRTLRCRRIARQPVSIVGRSRRKFRFPQDVAGAGMLLPGTESEIRSEFDAICEQAGVIVTVRAEVDDMAMMRLLARDTGALALLPSVVVRDELRASALHELCVVPGLHENFYAITLQRRFPHPLVSKLLERDEQEILAMTE
ncbi:MAG: LysR family transcriptional regulator [Deltaproteobacteria bacterium]|nr:LysR family transcriptional regulator [Deltaproteobacteria bacterium]